MRQKNLADLYHLDPIPWSLCVLEALERTESTAEQPRTYFLATTRPDGRPHSAGVGAVWDDGKVYFVSGAGTRKSRNLAQNADCAVSMSLDGDRPGHRGTRRTGDGRRDAAATRAAVRRRRLGADRQGRRLHPRVQRPECRPAAVEPVRGHAEGWSSA